MNNWEKYADLPLPERIQQANDDCCGCSWPEDAAETVRGALEAARAAGFREGLMRHTWMRDGVTYVGNGQYTLKEATEMAKRDGLLPSEADA